MKTYYQVEAQYKLSHGKPSLVSLSLHSTSVYFPYLVNSYTSPIKLSRYFLSIPEARQYIEYLFSRYPNSGLLQPVLDAHQLSLF